MAVEEKSATVTVLKSTEIDMPRNEKLCFQWCRYNYGDGGKQNGYRFIYKKANGNLQPARGQARLPSVEIIHELVEKAKKAGWGYNGSLQEDNT